MEHIIQEELLSKTRDLISPAQHGFLSGKSCTTNLITFTEDIATNHHNDTGIDVIYFDFAKAFDTVNHDVLLYKLKNHYKIDARLLKFLTNYLQNRHQRTSIENIFSRYLPVKSGVPQGSILGPLLFLLFINDISSGINSGTNICLFADDTKIWRSMNSEVDCAILQNDIIYLDNWCKNNQMKFHPDKCKVVSIITKSSKHKLTYLNELLLPRYCYTLGSSPLDHEANERNLGVIISSNFSWDDQHNQVINKVWVNQTCLPLFN